MNKELNLVEILKDCPKGTKLYSPVYGDVELVDVFLDEEIHPIRIKIPSNSTDSFTGKIHDFTKDGRLFGEYNGECLLFPSKDRRDWEKFIPFKDGDVLSYKSTFLKNRTIYIYKYNRLMNTTYYIALSGDTDSTFRISNKVEQALNGYNSTARFATEEEKQKLFQAIKDNGYKWNAETKTLEKLVPNRFDPNTLKPFDKVLVRDTHNGVWSCRFFSHIMGKTEFYRYATTNNFYKYCIPYNEETKHLVGTNEEAPEYYKYWED